VFPLSVAVAGQYSGVCDQPSVEVRHRHESIDRLALPTIEMRMASLSPCPTYTTLYLIRTGKDPPIEIQCSFTQPSRIPYEAVSY
jgi:hypothetical protein